MSHLTPYLAETWHQTLAQILKSNRPCSDRDLEWIRVRWTQYIQDHPPIPPPPPPPRFHRTLWIESPPEEKCLFPPSTEIFNSSGFKRVGSQALPATLDQIKTYTYGYDDWIELVKLHCDNEPILSHLIATQPAFWRRAHRLILDLELSPEIRLVLKDRAPVQKGHPHKKRASKKRPSKKRR
jgi:hypothetical protein